MVAYNFKPMFAPKILAGTKRQTIRADRKRHARPGEEIQLYTGMRTRQCKLIARATCESVEPIHIMFVHHGSENDWVLVNDPLNFPNAPGPMRGYKSWHALNEFARKDGFENWKGLRAFWEANHEDLLDWIGVLITWKPIGGQHGDEA